MTDREKLIELMIEAKKADTEDAPFLEFLADFLLAYGVTFAKDTDVPSKWISAEDEMPHAEYGESDNVLTVAENGLVEVLYFDGGCWCYPTGETVPYKAPSWRITHWMPLPEPPRVQGVPNGTDHV